MDSLIVTIDGKDKTANIIARLELEKTGIEYVYYYLDGEVDQNGDNYLFAGRVEIDDNGVEEVLEIIDEEEKQIAFEMFSSVYKDIQK